MTTTLTNTLSLTIHNSKNYIAPAVISLNSRGLRGAVLSSALVAWAARRFLGMSFARAFVSFFASIWMLTYRTRIVERATVSFHRSFWNNALVEKMSLPVFYPVFWAWHRHAQTIACFALSHLEKLWQEPITYARETIPAFDHPNVLFLDWASLDEAKHKIAHEQGPADTPVIVCVPGLGDDRNAPYVDRFVRSALTQGYRVVVHSYWRYDFEEARDLAEALDAVAAKYPSSPLIAIGWSAGVYALTRYLEKAGSDTPLIAAVCQSGCLDFPQAVDDVLNNENPSYGVFLDLQGRIAMRRHVDNDKTLTAEQKAAVELALAEEGHPLKLYARFLCIIQPLGSNLNKPMERHPLSHEGFIGSTGTPDERVASGSHYRFRAIDHVDRIKVTTLVLHAEDDPVVSSAHVDWTKVQKNKYIIVAHTKRGGHVAWYQGLSPWGDTWGDDASLRFMSAVLEQTSQTHFFVDIVQQTISRLQIGTFPLGGSGGNSHQITSRAMARICSASDLSSFAAVRR